MAISQSYLDWVLEILNDAHPSSPVTARRMFGGAGFYCEGVFFALIAEDTLYFRAGAANRADFEAVGCHAFVPFPNRPKPMPAMPYFDVPPEVLEDEALLSSWLNKALVAARLKD